MEIRSWDQPAWLLFATGEEIREEWEFESRSEMEFLDGLEA